MMTNRLLYAFLIMTVLFQPLSAFFPNIRLDSGPYTSLEKQEVTIAVNPRDPDNLIAASIMLYSYYSFDGGLSWETNKVYSPYGSNGDPSVIFDRFGTAYLAYIIKVKYSSIYKSYDGGKSWDAGKPAGVNPPMYFDKEWLAVDLTDSPYKDRLYLAWSEFSHYYSFDPNDSTHIMFSYSTDQSRTWSTPVRVSDQKGDATDGDGTVEGAVPAVGPGGVVHLSWAGNYRIMFDQSFDGGETFGKDIYVTDQPGGWEFNIPGLTRANGFAQTLCDTSHSPYRGNIYILWSDQRNGKDNTDIFLVKSTDQGRTWGEPVKVNCDTGRAHQFFPWGAIDPATGYLYVVFYDRRNHQNDSTDVYVAKSTDGGDTFVDFRVSVTPFLPDDRHFLGDYIGITALNGKIYPVWTRIDHGEYSIWTALVEEPVAVNISQQRQEQPVGFKLDANFPNPFNEQTQIRFTIPAGNSDIPVRLTLYNTRGQKVRTLVDGILPAGEYRVKLNGASLSAGIYFYELKAGSFRQTRKLVYAP